MGWTDAFVDEIKRDMANARAFVMCLTLALNTFTEDSQLLKVSVVNTLASRTKLHWIIT